ncbi:MAG: hypothetical protein ACYCYF_10475, partial [Anaerolineae bacterium]
TAREGDVKRNTFSGNAEIALSAGRCSGLLRMGVRAGYVQPSKGSSGAEQPALGTAPPISALPGGA